MGLIKRRPKRSKDILDRRLFISNRHVVENQPIPWKIFIMLIFLVILIYLLLRNDEEIPVAKKNIVIPDTEELLPPSSSKLLVFKNTAVCTDSQNCSDLTRNFMRSKKFLESNIFDAVILAILCNSLTNMQSMGLLGGFLLTAHLPSEKTSLVIDAQLTSPKLFPETIKNLNDVKQGALSIAVPNGLLGLIEMHRKYARAPWAEIFKPVIELCRSGVILTKHLRDSLELNPEILNDFYFKSLFIDEKSGKIKRLGSKIVMTKQCDFLEKLSKLNASEDLQSNEAVSMILSDLKDAGSVITIDDFRLENVKFEKAIEVKLKEYSILVPDTCAILIPAIVKTILKYDINATSFDSKNHFNHSLLTHHRITEVFKHVFAKRPELADPYFLDVKNISQYLISDDFSSEIIKSIDDDQTKGSVENYNLKSLAPKTHGTSHISIVNNENSISVTSSINYYFGSAVVGARSGLIFNNGQDDFSYPNRTFNYFGLEETPTNYPEPGKRALSSMSPIIVIDGKTRKPRLIIGSAGGSKIITAVSLAILRFMCGEDLKEIIDAPRFHHQLFPDVFEYEYGVLNSIIEGLKGKGHKTQRYTSRGTIINAIMLKNSKIYAISDFRKDQSGVAGF